MSETKRGFAAMSPERQREIASKGGKAAQASGKGHRYTPAEARVAGVKGGTLVSHDRAHMAEIGRKGGATASKIPGHMSRIGRMGGAAVSSDRGHMAEIGRIGGAVVSADIGHMAEIGRTGGYVRQHGTGKNTP